MKDFIQGIIQYFIGDAINKGAEKAGFNPPSCLQRAVRIFYGSLILAFIIFAVIMAADSGNLVGALCIVGAIIFASIGIGMVQSRSLARQRNESYQAENDSQ